MKFNIKSLLHDKNVLYIVAFLASMNILSYLIAGNYESIVFFGVVGYLATYFSKNMIVILLISMLTTNLLLGTRMLKRNVESMTTKRKEEEKEEEKEKEEEEESIESEQMSNQAIKEGRKKSIPLKEKMQPNIDYAATLEQAYDNLDKYLGSDGIKSMGEQTQRLAEKQKELMANIQNMEPVLKQASAALSSLPLDKLGSLQNTVSNALGKLSF
jgi:hypothetical protein